MAKIKRRGGEWLPQPPVRKLKPTKPRPTFAQLVAAELESARDGHDPINSLHEGLSVLQEEVHEFMLEVYKRRSKRNLKKTLAELVQVAAMAQRTAEDVLLNP
jgi:hypothetical protein